MPLVETPRIIVATLEYKFMIGVSRTATTEKYVDMVS
jgi:hypothetical protein